MPSLAFGIAAAKAAVEVDANVSPEYDLAKIANDVRAVGGGAGWGSVGGSAGVREDDGGTDRDGGGGWGLVRVGDDGGGGRQKGLMVVGGDDGDAGCGGSDGG
ncbi:hypothetical protein F0562_028075 [Nyssa sinensis]|uniref:Uncharacterized protein n=1 Tax=Nyssa sinensis TaxID=561372 RepID=A0A5J5B6L5_9ASTE|nr:hypothetical protein F0562_028075 [Nyssa sinensis]